MIGMPEVIKEIARERALNGRDMQVWVICVPLLDFVDFRPLPISRVAGEYRGADDPSVDPVSHSAICRSLRRLTEHGFLERSEARAARNVGLYRIPLRRVYPRRPII